ncbi:hypothetical protein ZIOFF_041993 [Zingiber officinale]|uniref:Uncharacterized protein n=1 Tax=Zingiber officinale TaxID=94328 RepID=A0A8J5KZ95_ZINOF|nr:hypothetical protein ZIOFF_041993 [Zingiber officinale]
MTEPQPYADCRRTPHIVFLPSSGMGHLNPFLRLAAQLSARDCRVSLLTTHPTVSAAEERHVDAFFAAFTGVRRLDLHLPLLDPSELNSTDPFWLRFESIRRSAHLLPRVLADASPPVSAAIVDISVASSYLPAVAEMGLLSYVLFTSSAAMLALCAYFPTYFAMKNTFGVGDIDIPGAGRVPKSSVPMPLRDPNQLFAKQFLENGQALPKANGILVNTLHAWEAEALAALNEGKVAPDMPPVLAIGPLLPAMSVEGESVSAPLAWLDRQPDRSVYVSFGNRTGMPAEQIRELGIGLERSGLRFLWVVKSKVVDRAEVEVGLEELLGKEYLAKIKDRGMVVKDWVEQVDIRRHRAVGGFLSHCGWNSVVEAALYGVRILGWPMGGDQRGERSGGGAGRTGDLGGRVELAGRRANKGRGDKRAVEGSDGRGGAEGDGSRSGRCRRNLLPSANALRRELKALIVPVAVVEEHHLDEVVAADEGEVVVVVGSAGAALGDLDEIVIICEYMMGADRVGPGKKGIGARYVDLKEVKPGKHNIFGSGNKRRKGCKRLLFRSSRSDPFFCRYNVGERHFKGLSASHEMHAEKLMQATERLNNDEAFKIKEIIKIEEWEEK